jgi:hypothetical protein
VKFPDGETKYYSRRWLQPLNAQVAADEEGADDQEEEIDEEELQQETDDEGKSTEEPISAPSSTTFVPIPETRGKYITNELSSHWTNRKLTWKCN